VELLELRMGRVIGLSSLLRPFKTMTTQRDGNSERLRKELRLILILKKLFVL
jgi:hypothetical protein